VGIGSDYILVGRRFAVVATAVVLAWSSSVSAQVDPNADPSIDVQRFEPITSPYGVFSVDSARGSSDLQLSGGLLLNYGKDPLIYRSSEGSESSIVSHQLAGELLFALGLFDQLEVGVSLPVYLANDAAIGDRDLSGATIGDLRLRPKLTVLDQEELGIGLAVLAYITSPTGDAGAFASNGQFSVRPGLALSTGSDGLEVMLNVSADLQPKRKFGDLSVGSGLAFGLGTQVEISQGVFLAGELFGTTDFDALFDEQNTPIEGLLGVKYRLLDGVNFELAAGRGLTAGYGSPALRVLGGVRYAEYENDFDDDGILNAVDLCVREPEDMDLFEDEDGCPDPDNDRDGILDVDDKCPMEAEDVDKFQDEDGCPDPDNDGDGVPDLDDACPLEKGPADAQGCPPPDKDKDGILDSADACPEDPEDKDGFEDADGCPDPDNDGDGILDKVDACPEEAEDLDQFLDEDGCPDPDNDRDGVPDGEDRCPDKPETINGYKDGDGCPDKGKTKVVITDSEIQILDKVYFATAKSTIKKKSYGLLDQVALALKANPELTRIEVQGHTDDVGGDAYNLGLSQSRAEAVVAYLTRAGVDPSRLSAKGYGETNPAVDTGGLRGRALKKARADNRRVQFVILKK
jgi:outer membrane protein OmpA-like peptidoglycan-associated protein